MTLEQRIADRLHWTLDRLAAAGRMLPAAGRGMCVDGPDAPTVVLTVEDVARIVATPSARTNLQRIEMPSEDASSLEPMQSVGDALLQAHRPTVAQIPPAREPLGSVAIAIDSGQARR